MATAELVRLNQQVFVACSPVTPIVVVHKVLLAKPSVEKRSVFQSQINVLHGSVRLTKTAVRVKLARVELASLLRSSLHPPCVENATAMPTAMVVPVVLILKENTVLSPVPKDSFAPQAIPAAAVSVCQAMASVLAKVTPTATADLAVPAENACVKAVESTVMPVTPNDPVLKATDAFNSLAVRGVTKLVRVRILKEFLALPATDVPAVLGAVVMVSQEPEMFASVLVPAAVNAPTEVLVPILVVSLFVAVLPTANAKTERPATAIVSAASDSVQRKLLVVQVARLGSPVKTPTQATFACQVQPKRLGKSAMKLANASPVCIVPTPIVETLFVSDVAPAMLPALKKVENASPPVISDSVAVTTLHVVRATDAKISQAATKCVCRVLVPATHNADPTKSVRVGNVRRSQTQAAEPMLTVQQVRFATMVFVKPSLDVARMLTATILPRNAKQVSVFRSNHPSPSVDRIRTAPKSSVVKKVLVSKT